MRLPRVLLINDGFANGHPLLLPGELPFRLSTAATLDDGLAAFRALPADAVVLDLNQASGPGMAVFRALRGHDPLCPVLVLAAQAGTEAALEVMKEGAFDFLAKPVDPVHLVELIGRAVDAAHGRRDSAGETDGGEQDRIIGHSRPIQEMCKLIGLLAPQDLDVLIVGESGSGKELAARSIHQHSRRPGPLRVVSCAGLTEPMLEQVLTGQKSGENVTLLLDEIGDASPAAQARLLRALRDRQPASDGETASARMRLLATTNQNLERRVATDRFRPDLYYRLRAAVVHVPALRERGEDVAELAQHFLLTYNHQLGLHLRGFGPLALDALRGYAWPGNVRELQSVVKEAMLRTRGSWVLPEYLPLTVRQAAAPAPAEPSTVIDLKILIDDLQRNGTANLYARLLGEVDRIVLGEVLRQTMGNQVRASAIMGIDRKTLRQKLRNLGLVPVKAPPSPEEGCCPSLAPAGCERAQVGSAPGPDWRKRGPVRE